MQTRRRFLTQSGSSLALAAAAPSLATSVSGNPKAILFDAFPIFDPRPVAALTEEVFPGRGAQLTAAWRSRQFEYTWLRNSMDEYRDFQQVTQDALTFAAVSLNLDLTLAIVERLMGAYLRLRPYPDVADNLKALRGAGIKLAFLSNFTARMLESCVSGSGLDGLFDHLLSTDAAKAFKPSARAYRLGIETLKLRRDEVVFAAYAGWDAAGAKRFGYRTFWLNRGNQTPEQLGYAPDGTGSTMADLVRFVNGAGRGTQ
jgi:2-haloacid dehalogenase